MLTIVIPGTEIYDEVTNEFIYSKETILKLEHSLVSISKWESKWQKPFLMSNEKKPEEVVDYIKCMSVSGEISTEVFNNLTHENIRDINAYIESPMTATWFSDNTETRGSKEIITSELIYYWMIAHNIPFECQKWHLNRLLTLIRVCNIKNTPPKKRTRQDILSRNAAINASRRNNMNSSG